MSDALTLGVYETRATQYAALPVSETQARSLNAFLDRLRPNAHVLDLGCGPGVHAQMMMAAGLQVTALDPCPAFISAARASGVDAHVASANELAAQGAYDAVWASFSLLHAPRCDMARHLKAIARALIPGGHLFLGMKLGEGEARDDLGRFYTYYSEAELQTLLSNAAFTVIDVETGQDIGLAGTVDPFILITARHD